MKHRTITFGANMPQFCKGTRLVQTSQNMTTFFLNQLIFKINGILYNYNFEKLFEIEGSRDSR